MPAGSLGNKAGLLGSDLPYLVMDTCSNGVVVCDAELRILYVNRAFESITGYSSAEVLGLTPRILSSGRQDKAFDERMWETLRQEGAWSAEVWNRRRSGEIYPEHLKIAAVRDDSGAIANYIGIFRDISLDKQCSQERDRLATLDPLTRLPNRHHSYALLDRSLGEIFTRNGRAALLYINLSAFRDVNGSLGHTAGDHVLAITAERLSGLVRQHGSEEQRDFVGRLGGDEFVVLLNGVTDPIEVQTVAKRILHTLKEPIAITDHVVRLKASIGITLIPSDSRTRDLALAHAQLAMHQARLSAPPGFAFFTPALAHATRRRLTLRDALAGALARGEMSLHYQPQIAIASGRLLGAEALLRWNSPDFGPVRPDEFIPLLEETGLIDEVGGWVIDAACAECHQWSQIADLGLRIAINLSTRQLHDHELAARIEAAIARYALSARQLEIEITEGTAIVDTAGTSAILHGIASLGVSIALDDFGTGYSSLAWLRDLHVNTLKIDRSFISGNADPGYLIVRATTALAHELGLTVLAEGVETVEQLDRLREARVDHVQGYLLGKPMPDAEFRTFIIHGHPMSRFAAAAA